MATIKGLVLRGVDGNTYFIEGGIGAARLKLRDPSRGDELESRIKEIVSEFSDAKLRKLQNELREGRPQSESPDQGPFIFQGFSVEVDRDDLGDLVTIQSAGNYTAF